MNTQQFSNKIIRHSELFAEVMSGCATLLKHSPNAEHAREYIKTRLSSAAQRDFNFGYFPKDNNLSELIELVSKDKLKELNLVYDKRFSDINIVSDLPVSIFNNHNLVLPYKNMYGDIISVVGRTFSSSEEQKSLKISKYKNSQFQKRLHLFGLYQAKSSITKKNAVILVEGQFDCISCHRHGFKNVVAVGSANLSKHQFFLLKRYTNNIYLLFDNDTAGKLGEERISKRYSNDAIIQKIYLPSNYKDIDEYLRQSSDYSILDI